MWLGAGNVALLLCPPWEGQGHRANTISSHSTQSRLYYRLRYYERYVQDTEDHSRILFLMLLYLLYNIDKIEGATGIDYRMT